MALQRCLCLYATEHMKTKAHWCCRAATACRHTKTKKLTISTHSQPEPIFRGILRFLLLVIFIRTQWYEFLITREPWLPDAAPFRAEGACTRLQAAHTGTLTTWATAGSALPWLNTAATHPASCFCIAGYFRNTFELHASPQLYWLWKRNGGLKKHSTSLTQWQDFQIVNWTS